MRLHRALITTFTAATIAVAGTALTANAASLVDVDTIDVDLEVSCDGNGFISVEVINPDGVYDFYYNEIIVDEDTTDSSNGSYEDGLVIVEVFEAGTETVVFSMNVPVACDAPYIDIVAECQEDGGHLLVLIAYNDEAEIDMYVDDTNTPVETGLEDTGFEYVDLGVYADGAHIVYGDWADDESEDIYFEEILTLACTDDSGSGAGIPPTGGSTSLALIAGLFVAAGGALLVTRRLRTA